jgi:hypothetical protein
MISKTDAYRPVAGGLLAALVFALLGISCRTAFYYFKEGAILFSAVNAVLWTVVSAAIFVPLYRSFRLTKATAIGSALYGAVFFFCFSYLFVNPSLTLKIGGNYIFQNGTITQYGLVQYFFLSLYDVAISVLCLIVMSKVRLGNK